MPVIEITNQERDHLVAVLDYVIKEEVFFMQTEGSYLIETAANAVARKIDYLKNLRQKLQEN